jgi:molecular chaperone DnaJ
MAKRDFYEVLGTSTGARRPTRSRRPIAGRPRSFTPTATRTIRTPSPSSRRSTRPMTSLKDPDKKAAYDRFGHAAFDGGMGGGPRPGGGYGGQGDFASAFSDVFDDLFGDFMGGRAGGGRRAPRAARICATTCGSRWKRPSRGFRKRSTCRPRSSCSTCSGTGAEGGAEPQTCPTCSGMGKVRAQQGFFTVERTCPTCSGIGQIIKNPCKACGGAGRVEKTARAQRQHPRRRRNRHPHPACRRGRGRAARRSFGRSLHLHRGGGAPDLPARRREPLLPGARLA